ncbi:MAG: aminopeptidase [Phycisphaerales bacterium]|nr:aminopeptidase [Phycisphaerales bacterium]
MIDPRLTSLARNLVRQSVSLRRGEHLLIETFDCPDEVAVALVAEARAVGGHPHVELRRTRVMRALNNGALDDQLKAWSAIDLARMKRMNCYIAIRGADNVNEMSGVSGQQMQRVAALYQKPVHLDYRVNHTRWCVLRWPSPSMAQLAQKSTEDFEDFYFNVCCLDYRRMGKAASALVKRMQRTDRVHIKGPGANDLRFSIKNIGVVPCCGDRNIPDGEVYTAPIRDSVEGVVHYNAATNYNGNTFEDVRLEFKRGKIVKCSARSDTDKLEAIFNTDEGARYIGEFAIGFNPHILEPMKDTLFDEKIAGSFHFTPGNCYKEASNGNKSRIHWDMVCIQRPEYGGGTISFDGEVIRRDGMFVVSDLKPLNPSNLLRQQ